MPIQYRCRCGQEVVLRPREGIYLVVCLLIGLTLTNAILTTLLWFRVGDDPGTGNNAVAVERSETPEKRNAPSEVRGATSEKQTEVPKDGAGAIADAGESAAGSDDAAKLQSDVDPDPTVGDDLDAAADLVPTSMKDTSEEQRVTDKPEVTEQPRSYRFECPPQLDGVMVSYLLAHLSDAALADPLDRTMVLLACTRWGSGPPRQAAFGHLERVQAGDEDLERLAMLWQKAADRSQPAVVIGDGASDERRRILSGLERRWNERWPELLTSVGPERSRRWVAEASRALAERSDLLVLVDLTESMTPDIEAVVDALKDLVPVSCADGRRRWGWIAYRDEVVDTAPLTDDSRSFNDSLARWQCGDGGDVPEGVDRALHEALRFESFDWQEQGERVFIVIGDAPPAYENIAGMTTLAEAAHRSPEAYRVHCLGFLREKDWAYVPSFREVATAAGGDALFLAEGADPAASLWRLLAGPGAPPWGDRPF